MFYARNRYITIENIKSKENINLARTHNNKRCRQVTKKCGNFYRKCFKKLLQEFLTRSLSNITSKSADIYHLQ